MKTQLLLLGKLYQIFFSFYTLITLVTLHTEFGLVWTAPWPDQTDLFLKFLIRVTQKVPYEIRMKHWLFTRPIIANTLFVLDSTYNGDTTCRVWLDLDNSKTQSITTTFKFRFSRNSQIFVWKRIFFRRQAIANIFFVLHSTYFRNTLFRVWFNLNNLLTQSKKNYS